MTARAHSLNTRPITRRDCVAPVITEPGAEGPRDMGKAIKHVMSAAGGRADGKAVSGKVKEALTA